MYESIIFTSQDSIGLLKLNRPEKLNAFGGPIRDEILDLLPKVASDETIRVLVITGEGKGFSAGGDIDHLKQLRENKDEKGFRTILGKGQQITRSLRALSKPVIAAVNGPCAGAGFSFALGCDIRIASDKATFGPSFALIGLHPDWGGSWFLPKLVGTAKACELVFRGTMISAQEAEKIGLVNAVVAHYELLHVVGAEAEIMAKNPPGVLQLAKESIYGSLNSDLEAAFARETEAQLKCFYSEDFLEGVTAFLEKRQPRFKGH